MSTDSATSPPAAASDAHQKKKLIQGVLVWVFGWCLAFGLVPVVHSMDISSTLKTTLDGILLLGFPKLFLLMAVAIMGKPGFAYLKSLAASRFRRMAPPATVGTVRYRIGMTMFISLIVLASIGPYMAHGPLRLQYPNLVPAVNDLLMLVSLFVLGGDFWDKLRALFIRDARVVFPEK